MILKKLTGLMAIGLFVYLFLNISIPSFATAEEKTGPKGGKATITHTKTSSPSGTYNKIDVNLQGTKGGQVEKYIKVEQNTDYNYTQTVRHTDVKTPQGKGFSKSKIGFVQKDEEGNIQNVQRLTNINTNNKGSYGKMVEVKKNEDGSVTATSTRSYTNPEGVNQTKTMEHTFTPPQIPQAPSVPQAPADLPSRGR